jgi:pyridoxine 5-phosphate synthase
MAKLGVNIDHVATVRQARRTYEPDPVWAAVAAQLGGADGITIHLREDRRHIQDRDLRLLKQIVTCKLNLELACCDEIVDIACQVQPDQATLVPERREEITTEGGLDVLRNESRLAAAVQRLKAAGIVVSLFLDPDAEQIQAGARLGAHAVELHTGEYARARGDAVAKQLELLRRAGQVVVDCGLTLHAGHGLNYLNVQPVAAIAHMDELNIGHAIVARALFVGMQAAVRDMKRLIHFGEE